MTGHRGAAALTKLGPGGEFLSDIMPEKNLFLNCFFFPFSETTFSLLLSLIALLHSTFLQSTGLRDMGIALVCGIVGAAVWSQVAHANRRDWEQANRVSLYTSLST